MYTYTYKYMNMSGQKSLARSDSGIQLLALPSQTISLARPDYYKSAMT